MLSPRGGGIHCQLARTERSCSPVRVMDGLETEIRPIGGSQTCFPSSFTFDHDAKGQPEKMDTQVLHAHLFWDLDKSGRPSNRGEGMDSCKRRSSCPRCSLCSCSCASRCPAETALPASWLGRMGGRVSESSAFLRFGWQDRSHWRRKAIFRVAFQLLNLFNLFLSD